MFANIRKFGFVYRLLPFTGWLPTIRVATLKADASYLEEQIRDRRKANKNLKHISIVSNGINDIDA